MASTRRDFHRNVLGSLMTYGLLETLWSRDLFAAEVKPVVARWFAELPESQRRRIELKWGPQPGAAYVHDGDLCLAGLVLGNALVAQGQFAEAAANLVESFGSVAQHHDNEDRPFVANAG